MRLGSSHVALIALLLCVAACGGGRPGGATDVAVTPGPSGGGGDRGQQIDTVVASRLPAGAPVAALLHPATVAPPDPAIWPFATAIPKISGSGRYANGAFYWADFLYDATGARGNAQYNTGTPTGGGLHYPGTPQFGDGNDGKYDGNAADIFAIGIGALDGDSYWRVDWQTFVDATAAILAIGLDYDNDTGTGTDGNVDWPGVPRIRTAGIDAVLLLSSAGVFLADAAGVSRLGDIAIVDSSQSMIARIDSAALPPLNGTWKIYALSGVHDGNGGFLDDMPAFRGRASDPPVFNATFRDYTDEGLLNNFWMNETQANDLAMGSVDDFFVLLDWSRLGITEPEPRRVGEYSARWYVSSLGEAHFGRQGQWTGGDAQTQRINHFDRIQPYGMYVPSDYDYDDPQPTTFTLLLHSFTQNYNQYSATVPNYLRETCEDLRRSICLTTLGRGQAGGYLNEAELDLWEAAADIARDHRLDPERVYSTGYSMGAIGTIRLLIKYPHVFAGGVVLAGAQSDEESASGGLADVSGCFGEQQLWNIVWNGYYQTHGSLDQLIPINEALDTVATVKDFGYRYTFDHYLVEDHVAWTLKDLGYPAFRHATEWLRDTAPQQRKANPGEIRYLFSPRDQRSDLGLGAFGAWWISELAIADPDYRPIAACADDPGGRVHAISRALPEQPFTPVPADPPPVQHDFGETIHDPQSQSWTLGVAPTAQAVLELMLENVARISVDMIDANLGTTPSTIELTTDVPVVIRLLGLADGVTASEGGNFLGTSSDGVLELDILAAADDMLIDIQ